MSEGVDGRRIHFSVLATTTPKLLVDKSGRQALVIYNAASVNVRIGLSGSLSSQGMLLGALLTHYDLFSNDEWWVLSESSSGTVCGYYVI